MSWALFDYDLLWVYRALYHNLMALSRIEFYASKYMAWFMPSFGAPETFCCGLEYGFGFSKLFRVIQLIFCYRIYKND